MSFKKTLIAGSLIGLSSISAVGCADSVDTSSFDDGNTDMPDGGVDGDSVLDSGKIADAAVEDGGKNCDQVNVSFNGPPSMTIEQGVFEVKLFCLEMKTSCHDQILNALNFQTIGTLTAKDYSNTYGLRDGLDKPVGTFKNPGVSGEVNFNELADALVADTTNQLCVIANIAMSAPVLSTIGLKVTKGGVILADSKTAINPNAEIVGNMHAIVAKK